MEACGEGGGAVPIYKSWQKDKSWEFKITSRKNYYFYFKQLPPSLSLQSLHLSPFPSLLPLPVYDFSPSLPLYHFLQLIPFSPSLSLLIHLSYLSFSLFSSLPHPSFSLDNSLNLNIELNPLHLPIELDNLHKFICININSFPKHHDDLSNLISTLSANFLILSSQRPP